MGNFRLVEKMNKYYSAQRYLKDRDLSILEFNMRVFDQIFKDIPVMEKLNFIYIVFKNLDEFISIKLAEASESDKLWYIHTMEKMYYEMNRELENILAGEKFEDNKPDSVIDIRDGQVYLVLRTSAPTWLIIPGPVDKRSMIKELKESTPGLMIDCGFYIRFISDKSFLYHYSGEATNDVLSEIESVVQMKDNVDFKFIQTSCSSKCLMKKFLAYLQMPNMEIIYTDSSIIRCESIIKRLKRDNTNIDSLYFPKHVPIYRNIVYKHELMKKDMLVYNPYEDYRMVLDFINEMCNHPDITTIFVSLYRVAKKSEIIKSLAQACLSQKDVYVYIEPTARGNEDDNISNIKRLTDLGAHVSCNYFDYKVHAKIFCAVDVQGNVYAHIGTGNYNEDTAKVYTDIHLLTANPRTTSELLRLFQAIFKKSIFRSTTAVSWIASSPSNFRSRIVNLIRIEKEKGVNGKISLKCNSLCDSEIIDQLYRAAEAGVRVNIICRTGCSITSHPNITIKSKVGRFLEHDRIYIFGNRTYISSADLLLRNISKRVEVLCEVTDPDSKNRLISIYDSIWNDPDIYILLENGRWDKRLKSVLEHADEDEFNIN